MARTSSFRFAIYIFFTLSIIDQERILRIANRKGANSDHNNLLSCTSFSHIALVFVVFYLPKY